MIFVLCLREKQQTNKKVIDINKSQYHDVSSRYTQVTPNQNLSNSSIF